MRWVVASTATMSRRFGPQDTAAGPEARFPPIDSQPCQLPSKKACQSALSLPVKNTSRRFAAHEATVSPVGVIPGGFDRGGFSHWMEPFSAELLTSTSWSADGLEQDRPQTANNATKMQRLILPSLDGHWIARPPRQGARQRAHANIPLASERTRVSAPLTIFPGP